MFLILLSCFQNINFKNFYFDQIFYQEKIAYDYSIIPNLEEIDKNIIFYYQINDSTIYLNINDKEYRLATGNYYKISDIDIILFNGDFYIIGIADNFANFIVKNDFIFVIKIDKKIYTYNDIENFVIEDLYPRCHSLFEKCIEAYVFNNKIHFRMNDSIYDLKGNVIVKDLLVPSIKIISHKNNLIKAIGGQEKMIDIIEKTKKYSIKIDDACKFYNFDLFSSDEKYYLYYIEYYDEYIDLNIIEFGSDSIKKINKILLNLEESEKPVSGKKLLFYQKNNSIIVGFHTSSGKSFFYLFDDSRKNVYSYVQDKRIIGFISRQHSFWSGSKNNFSIQFNSINLDKNFQENDVNYYDVSRYDVIKLKLQKI